MADPFTGEIRFFGFNYAPMDWAYCNGAQMTVQQNPALFSILANRFGGDGQQTFNLPNLQGRALAGVGVAPTYSPVGQTGGSAGVTLTGAQSPPHQHGVQAMPLNPAVVAQPAANSYLAGTVNAPSFSTTDIDPWQVSDRLAPATIQPALGGTNGVATAHENRQPFLALNACICLYGEYPVRP